MAYFDKYGVEFSNDRKTLIKCPKDFEGDYIVPNGVTIIGDHAFDSCYGLHSIIIGRDVDRIGICAFSACGLTTAIIPSNVTYIDEEAYSFCEQLKYLLITGGVKIIKRMAFYHCTNLTHISIPNCVQEIEEGVFVGCNKIASPVHNSKLFVCMPDSYSGSYSIPDGIEMVAPNAFMSNKYLKSLTIPRSLKDIDFLSLSCENLETLTLHEEIIDIPTSSDFLFVLQFEHIKEINVPFGQKERFARMDGLKEYKDKIVECDIDGIGKTKYIFFDTETTGVPRNYKAPMQDTANWPRLVQLAWLLVDEKGTELKRKSVIIRPDGFTIPEETLRVHGITTERAQKEGLPLRNVLDEFMQDLELAEEVVGHNIDFDIHIMGAELCRLGLSTQTISNKPRICTMKSFTNYCAIPSNNGYGGYKWPTLEELYFKVFGREMENAHDALADILATKECFFELRNKFKSKASSVPTNITLTNSKKTDLSDLPF